MAGRRDARRRAALTRRQFVGWSAAGLAAIGGGVGTLARRAGGAGVAAAELTTDVLIVGGGVGGVAAALAALRLGRSVILTEETDWIGGQLTSQAVPPDENPWIETTGCTATYRQFRNAVRQYYREKYALRKAPYASPFLNPGAGYVSALCHEPQVALAVLNALLRTYNSASRLTVLLKHVPTAVDFTGDRVDAVTFAAPGGPVTINAPFVLDATELGDLLELAEVERVTGAESQQDQPINSREDHALPLDTPSDPLDQQAVSWCFPLEYLPGETHTIARPAQYTFWRDYRPDFWTGKLLSWTDVHPETLEPRTRYLFDGPTSGDYFDLWHFRRIFWHDQCLFGLYPSDLTTVNWPQIDYWIDPGTGDGAPLVGPGVTAADRQKALDNAKQLSLSWLYWMQTEAPRPPGQSGVGYPGLRLRPDVVGTENVAGAGKGLAKAVYIRESRRIRAKSTVYEKHIGVAERRRRGLPASAEVFPDSVGIGYYRIDLHPSTGGTTFPGGRTYVDIESYRFQIPLGALLPVRVENLLPAAKNIGTTHVTNGCYRLHPVEWTIGEAAGALAAYCLNKNKTPAQVWGTGNPATNATLADFQATLRNPLGFVLEWPNVSGQEYPDGKRYGGGG